ncbi:hypothetical protein L218DRAFT_990153 [Marasmius fiardii PR-910]|nr:hypothetical protein L218DRAFT_990153 [Marasmius fiardii PR-910]
MPQRKPDRAIIIVSGYGTIKAKVGDMREDPKRRESKEKEILQVDLKFKGLAPPSNSSAGAAPDNLAHEKDLNIIKELQQSLDFIRFEIQIVAAVVYMTGVERKNDSLTPHPQYLDTNYSVYKPNTTSHQLTPPQIRTLNIQSPSTRLIGLGIIFLSHTALASPTDILNPPPSAPVCRTEHQGCNIKMNDCCSGYVCVQVDKRPAPIQLCFNSDFREMEVPSNPPNFTCSKQIRKLYLHFPVYELE